jgi:hypothetical protein
MAYEDFDVTSSQADTAYGPLWAFDGVYTETVDETFDPSSIPGWLRLGQSSTDGVTSEQASDQTDKLVWTKNLGSTFTNFKDTLVVRFASTLDVDVLGFVFGKQNVTVSGNAVHVKVGPRQPAIRSFAVFMKSDDGSRKFIFIQKAQPDLNMTRDFNEDGITVIETTLACLESAPETTHEEFTLKSVAPVAPETPAA